MAFSKYNFIINLNILEVSCSQDQ